MYVFIKIMISGIIIGAVTEIARRFPTYGGILAALPLISILSILWLTVQGEPSQNINKFVIGVLLGLPATAVMLVIIYLALKQSLHVAMAISLGMAAWALFLVFQKLLFGFLHFSI
jgi:hypothetical protein